MRGGLARSRSFELKPKIPRKRCSWAFMDTLGGARVLGPQSAREVEQQPLGRLHVGGLIGAAKDGLSPWPIAIAHVLEDIARLVDHRPAPLDAARRLCGRPTPPRCSPCPRARPGARLRGHSAAHTGPSDPPPTLWSTPSGPNGPRARTARFARRPADRRVASGGDIQQASWAGLCETPSWRFLSVRLSPRVWPPLV